MKILHIEDNPGDARLVKEMLKGSGGSFTLHTENSLEAGLQFLSHHKVDVVLLDLGLPGSRGLDTLTAFQSKAAGVPVVVMTSQDDEGQGIRAVRQGAKDYLVKGQLDSRLLRRSILYALERRQWEESLKKAEAAKRAVEEDYRLIFETANEGIWLTDINAKTLLVNKHLADMLGYTVEEMTGRSFYDFISPADMAASLERKQRRLQGESETYELELLRKDGTKIWTLVSGAPMFAQKRFAGHLAMITDITDRKKIEQLKDEFIGMVSHELKTPLTVVMGSLYTVLSEGLTREDRLELIKNAISGSENLASIMENLLELSRSQAKRLELVKRTADIVEVVNRTVSKLSNKSPGHHLVIDITQPCPPVEIDPVRIERLLSNLIDNAIKYSPGGGEVKIFSQREKENLLIGVQDQGIGISPENQAKLFDRFQRLDRWETSNIPGVGLGLHVCKILVEAHGGKIWVESKPRCGSTFFFTVPLAKQA